MMKKIIIFVFAIAVCLAVTAPSQAAFSAGGSAVLAPDGTIYFITSTEKRPFPTPNVYFSHGFKFADATPASDDDLSLPTGNAMIYRDGTLVKAANGAVFITSDAKKYGITSADVFRKLGYNFANVVNDEGNLLSGFLEGRNIDNADLPHIPGTLVNWSGAIYLITSNGKKGITTLEVFNSYRYDFKNAVVANLADKSLHVEGQVALREIQMPEAPQSPPPPAPSPEPSPIPAPAPAVPANAAPSVTISGVTGIFLVNIQTFIFSATDPDSDALTVVVDFGDGTKIAKAIASGESFSLEHFWDSTGDYIISAAASDGKGGNSQASHAIKVSSDPTEFGPAVTLISPNGGGVYTQGKPITITWRRNWVPLYTTGKVDIGYTNSGTNVSIKTAVADSSYTWIPIDLAGSNNYKIVVTSTGTGGSMLSDQSDSPFTISAVLGAINNAY